MTSSDLLMDCIRLVDTSRKLLLTSTASRTIYEKPSVERGAWSMEHGAYLEVWPMSIPCSVVSNLQ